MLTDRQDLLGGLSDGELAAGEFVMRIRLPRKLVVLAAIDKEAQTIGSPGTLYRLTAMRQRVDDAEAAAVLGAAPLRPVLVQLAAEAVAWLEELGEER